MGTMTRLFGGEGSEAISSNICDKLRKSANCQGGR